MLLSDLLAEFVLYSRAANRSPETISWYTKYFGRFQRWLAEHHYPVECDSITARMVREYIADLRDRHAPHTISNSVRSVKAVFAWAVREELLGSNPLVRIPVPKIPRTDYEVFDVEQVERLLRACDVKAFTGARAFAIVILLFDSGIRAAELVGIRDQDVDWQRGLFKVRGKGAKERQVPVSARTLRAVRRYVTQRDRFGLADGGRLFVGPNGRALTYSGLAQLLRRLGKRTGLHVHPHKFRHSFAVNALRNDASLADIQDQLGHADLTITRHYARQSATDLARNHKRYSPADRLRVRV